MYFEVRDRLPVAGVEEAHSASRRSRENLRCGGEGAASAEYGTWPAAARGLAGTLPAAEGQRL